MHAFDRFKTDHEDLIHDIAYDYYGKRLATCSADQHITIWDLCDDENEDSAFTGSIYYDPQRQKKQYWKKTASWKGMEDCKVNLLKT
jgi:hypothetical protein